MTRVVSLGLDGAAWHKLDRLVDAGKLPNLERLVDRGARATLRSVTPPVTCPAWRCSTSGKNPGKLGVYWWLNLDREAGRFESPDATSFDTADVWDYLAEAGYRSAILNVPMTYPPRELDGLMVSGFGTPLDGGDDRTAPMTYPASFQDELFAEYDWAVDAEDVEGDDWAERALELLRTRLELLTDVLDDGYDYVHLTLFYLNMLQHKCGDGPETERAWRLVDDYLGEVYDDDRLLVLYSDHGHSNVRHTFNVNTWLAERGYLTTDGDGDSVASHLYRLLESTGLSPRSVANVAATVLPDQVYERLVPSDFSTAELMEQVVWDRSTAVATSQGPIYINRSAVRDYEAVRAELKAALEDLTYEGEPVFDAVYEAESVYSGPYLDDAPDLLLVAREGWEIYGGLTPSVFENQTTSWTTGNHPEGMALLAGDGVQSADLGEQSLLDVMPTILHYLDVPVPSDADGSVMHEALDADPSDVEVQSPIRPGDLAAVGEDADHREELEGKLEDLGYLE